MRTKIFSSLSLALLVLAGCTTSVPNDTPPPVASPSTHSGYQVRDGIHFSEHWAQTPVVDLMSADGTFIRAFAESRTLQNFSGPGEPDGPDGGQYPGYARANQTRNSDGGGWFDAVYGYTTRWIMSFEEAPDNTATVVVCSYVSINPTNEDSPMISGLTLRYHRTGTPPPLNQKGPARAPAAPVFGDWYATTYGYAGEDNHTADARCFKDRPAVNKSPVPTPGWPAQSGV